LKLPNHPIVGYTGFLKQVEAGNVHGKDYQRAREDGVSLSKSKRLKINRPSQQSNASDSKPMTRNISMKAEVSRKYGIASS